MLKTNREWLNSLDNEQFAREMVRFEDEQCKYFCAKHSQGTCMSLPHDCYDGYLEWLGEYHEEVNEDGESTKRAR